MLRINLTVGIIILVQFVLKAQVDTNASNNRYSIKNCITVFDSTKVQNTKSGNQFWFIDSTFAKGKTLKLSIVKPGKATHMPHRHEQDEIFFILEGEAEFYLNGETRKVGPNTSLYCPPWIEHNLRNSGETDLKYLVIKKY